MDFFRQQLVIIQERLRGLSASQKMLAGTLIVIMAMTMLYWGKFASSREMVALFPTAISGAELQAATATLTANGISFDDAGGNLRVHADQQYAAITAMASAAASSTTQGSNALEAMLDKLSPLSTQGEFTARMHVAREKKLVAMMLTWTGVRTAEVHVSESIRGGLNPTPAGVFINLTTKNNANPRKLASAALAAVLPVVPHLKRDGVTVTVDGVALISPNGNGGGFNNGELIEARTSYENFYAQEIKKFYASIPGLQVTVTAEVSAETKKEKIDTVDPLNKVSLPTSTTNEETTTSEAGPLGEPGTIPNTGIDATTTAMPRNVAKTKRSEELSENFVGRRETLIDTPAGQAKILSAMVRVPREHFAKVWKLVNKGTEPTEEQLDGLVQRELSKMRTELMATMLIADETKVVVNEYVGFEDPSVLVANTAIAAAGPGGTLTALTTSHGKEVAIGALALTSLFMVGRMVKKATPAPVAPLLALDDMPDISKKPRKPGPIGMMEIAGEVGEGGVVMTGTELDEGVLETSQMVDQVSGFVKDNPEMTAQLLRRWMNRD